MENQGFSGFRVLDITSSSYSGRIMEGVSLMVGGSVVRDHTVFGWPDIH